MASFNGWPAPHIRLAPDGREHTRPPLREGGIHSDGETNEGRWLDRAAWAATAAGAGLAAVRALERGRRERADVAGRRKQLESSALEAGSRLLHRATPLSRLDVYLVGFHPMKDSPSMQMEAHHYCRQRNEDVMQCILFDGAGSEARLNGVEVHLSERLYESLPKDEKQYWHPHNYEILSGQLIAPGIPAPVEKELMRRKLSSYGKTWHVWHTGGPRHPADALPLGPARLAWSFDLDGEADAQMIAARDRRAGLETSSRRDERASLCGLAHPQRGVDLPGPAFPAADGRPAGVAGKW